MSDKWAGGRIVLLFIFHAHFMFCIIWGTTHEQGVHNIYVCICICTHTHNYIVQYYQIWKAFAQLHVPKRGRKWEKTHFSQVCSRVWNKCKWL